MTHDVSRLHAGHEVVKEMKVRPADSATGNLDDRIAFVLDLRIRNPFATDIRRAVPNERLHTGLRREISIGIEPLLIVIVPKDQFFASTAGVSASAALWPVSSWSSANGRSRNLCRMTRLISEGSFAISL
jgi:hypothetical protein